MVRRVLEGIFDGFYKNKNFRRERNFDVYVV